MPQYRFEITFRDNEIEISPLKINEQGPKSVNMDPLNVFKGINGPVSETVQPLVLIFELVQLIG